MKTPGSMLLFACTLFAVAGIGSCAALDCYDCSFPASNCGDPFDPAGVTPMACPSGNVCTAQNSSSGGTEVFSRGCTEADSCTTGCVTSEGVTSCSYCCNEDRCNSRSIADAVADILHCYYCTYKSASNFSSPACNDPFNPNGDGVVQYPCADGQCGVLTTNHTGQSTLSRLCISDSTSPRGCTPGCDALGITCQTCCSENLCNVGLAATPSTTKPSAATPTVGGGKASLAAISLVSAGLLVVLR
ncbi:uncharacterized protein LOC119725598 [Patiria miniata]|uniref:Uncharacterized protein n=1 Tax=Patiria miniata TaxID=46514 RepID=A0A913ZML6_PATMI|nr:uncharacterized protein LOC119725598 [Patiria miniata]XP_038052992.1 uncharacterized protein LOC119725598 [Patiria miniata]